MTGDLDLGSNAVKNVAEIRQGGSTTTINLDSSNNVEIPNGNLDIGGSAVTMGSHTPVEHQSFGGGGTGIVGRTYGDIGFILDDDNNDGSREFIVGANNDSISDATQLFKVSEGGNVQVLNGNLSMNNNYITSVSTATGQSNSLINVGEADTRYLQRSGDSMNGDLDMGSNVIKNVAELRQDGATTAINLDS